MQAVSKSRREPAGLPQRPQQAPAQLCRRDCCTASPLDQAHHQRSAGYKQPWAPARRGLPTRMKRPHDRACSAHSLRPRVLQTSSDRTHFSHWTHCSRFVRRLGGASLQPMHDSGGSTSTSTSTGSAGAGASDRGVRAGKVLAIGVARVDVVV